MIPDPLRLAIALVPVTSYLLLIGLLNLRKHPFLTSGSGDLASLGAAMSGLVLIGPIELFRPEAASAEFGGYVWFFLLVFYWLWVWLAVLLARPRLVIYNIGGDELRPLLAETARSIDPQSRWAGDSLSLPTLGVHLHIETSQIMRNASLVAAGTKQELSGWRILATQLHKRTRTLQVTRNPRSLSFLLTGGILLAVSIWKMVTFPQQVAQAMQEMLSL